MATFEAETTTLALATPMALAMPTTVPKGSWRSYLVEHGHVVHRYAEVCAEKGCIVRAGVALDSKKVAKLPHRAPLSVIREARAADGVLRLRVRTRPGSFCPAPVDGWVSDTTGRGTKLVETTDAHPPEDDGCGGRQGDAPSGVVAFCDFVLADVLRADELCRGSGCLDVAGGGGPLSSALAKRGVRCNLVGAPGSSFSLGSFDRPFEMELFTRPRRRFSPASPVRGGIAHPPQVDPAAPDELRPAARDDIKKVGGPLYRIYKKRFEAGDPEPDAPRGGRDDDDDEKRTLKRGLGLDYCQAVGTCSALLGYRPCAATESIVDHAIRRRKPFAILPCCAYAVDGQSVSGLHDMADKLQKKDASIKRTVCAGSLVLYSTFGREPPGSVLREDDGGS